MTGERERERGERERAHRDSSYDGDEVLRKHYTHSKNIYN
jgi:hypothetical protein